MKKIKPIKAWAVYGVNNLKGKIIDIKLEEPTSYQKEIATRSEYPFVVVEITPMNPPQEGR